MINWAKDWKFAMTNKQMENHFIHVGIATGLTLFAIYVPLSIWARSLVLILAIAGPKEWYEVMKKIKLGNEPHWWDGVLDFAGWLVAWAVTYSVWRWLQ